MQPLFVCLDPGGFRGTLYVGPRWFPWYMSCCTRVVCVGHVMLDPGGFLGTFSVGPRWFPWVGHVMLDPGGFRGTLLSWTQVIPGNPCRGGASSDQDAFPHDTAFAIQRCFGTLKLWN